LQRGHGGGDGVVGGFADQDAIAGEGCEQLVEIGQQGRFGVRKMVERGAAAL